MVHRPTVIDLFAGCGGLSLGLEYAGFEPVLVSELNPSAMATYLKNRPHLPVQEPSNQITDILSVSQAPEELDALSRRLRRDYGQVDLVVGGPPCQGYSGIGHRRTFNLDKMDIPSNHLYREFARFITATAPKAFIFENVRGLLFSRWTPGGEKGEIWGDVKHELSSIVTKVDGKEVTYEFVPKLLFAKDYGVPQNRPRVIGIGIRSDLADQISVDRDDWHPRGDTTAPHPHVLLDDLVDPDWQAGPTRTYLVDPMNDTQREFRTKPSGEVLGAGSPLTEQEYSRHSARVMERFRLIRERQPMPATLQTKKFAQRPLPREWDERGPTITVASMPDDFVHYSQDRAPTVREWARLQTFPDWYRFEGPRTTGGRRRAGDPSIDDWSRDVPKFTQIGNAVPVKMAEALGTHLKALLGIA